MIPGERSFRARDGREWTAALEAPGSLLGVPPELKNVGAMLPEEAVRIVFRSGEETVGEEYTGLTPVEELSEEDLQEWLDAAMRGRGL
jgi:hypothetical protein